MPLTSRTDNYLTLILGVDYPFKDWLIGGVGYVLQYNQTDAQLGTALPGAMTVPLNYLKNEVFLRLSMLY
jgi:hypothetical protein